MLRPMHGMGVDTMAMPDGPDTPVPAFNPMAPASSWSMFPDSAFVSTNPRMTQLPNNNQSVSFAPADEVANNFPGIPSYAAATPPASGGILDSISNFFTGPKIPAGGSIATKQVPAKYTTATPAQVKTMTYGPPAPASFKSNSGGAGAGTSFLDILKGITGAAPAAVNAYLAVTNPPAPAGFLRDPKTGKLIPIQTPQFSSGGATQISSGTPWGTYALIGGGVVLAGIAVVALTRKKRKSRR